MPTGRILNFNRPFVSDSTIKLMRAFDEPSDFSKENFRSLLYESTDFRELDIKFVPFGRDNNRSSVVVDTTRDNVRFRRLDRLKDTIEDALIGAGAVSVEETTAVVTPTE